VPLRTSLLPAGGVTLAAALALGIWLLGVRSWNPYLTLLIAGAGSLMSGGLMILATPLLRQEARAGWKNWQARGWRAFSLKTRNAAPAAPTR